MRRKERAVTDIPTIRSILDEARVCTLSMARDNVPYGVMLNYGYTCDEAGAFTFYFHCAAEGKKVDILKKYPDVHLSIFGEMAIEGAELPCSYTTKYASVMCEGRIAFIEALDQKRAALDVIMHNHGMQGKGEYADGILSQVLLMKLEARALTAKSNR